MTALWGFFGAVALAAPANPCPEAGLPEGPLQVAYLEGDFGVARRACPRTEVSLRGRGMALLDTANFYGSLGGDLELGGSYRFSDEAEVFAALGVLQHRFVQNATLKGTRTTLGAASAGGTYVFKAGEDWLAAGSARLSFPTSTAYANAWPFGLEVGGAGRIQPKPWLVVHGYLGLLTSAAVTAGNAQPRLGVSLIAGAEVSPWSFASLVVDLNALFLYAYGLDHLAPSVGLRFQILRKLGLELAVLYPLAGGTRYDFAGALRLSWRVGR